MESPTQYYEGSDNAAQIDAAYQLPTLYAQGLTGQGVTVAIVDGGPYIASDVSGYQQCYGTHVPITIRGSGDQAGEYSSTESNLDVESVITTAPGANILFYTGSSGFYAEFEQVFDDDSASIVSLSYIDCETDPSAPSDDFSFPDGTLFEQAAAQGQDVFVASGDTGSETCSKFYPKNKALTVGTPADQPFVTAVGGTQFNQSESDAPTVTPSQEATWDDDYGTTAGSGGGISTLFAMPSYQSGPGVLNSYSSSAPCEAATGNASTDCREVPDVSAFATGLYIYDGGRFYPEGGTSLSAPLFAGLMAVVSQGCPIGFANPALYQAAADPGSTPAFTDITTGNNDVLNAHDGTYPATTGYDQATGLGSPLAAGLRTHLCGAPSPPSPPAHSVIISQLRLGGPGGAADSYVDLYNTTSAPIDVAGWSLGYFSTDPAPLGQVADAMLPATTIPVHGHLLMAGSGYSLGSIAAADGSFGTPSYPIEAAGGVEVLGPDGSTVVDKVGYSSAPVGIRDGVGLPTTPSTTSQDAFVRNEVAGVPVDTDNNAADFVLVAPGGPSALAGSVTGEPSPTDLASPVQVNAIASSSLLDPSVLSSMPPNRVVTSSPTTLTVRRTITNTSTTETLSNLEMLISSITTPGVAGTHANLLVEPSTTSVVTADGVPVTVHGLTLSGTNSADGGLDTVLTVPGALAPGQSISVAFLFDVPQGGSYSFSYDVLANTAP